MQKKSLRTFFFIMIVLAGFVRDGSAAPSGSGTQPDDSWNATEELETMTKDLRELMDKFLNREAGQLRRTAGRGFYAWSGPALDMRMTEKELIVECDVPGWSKKEIQVELQNNVLVIKGSKPAEAEGTYYARERWHEAFERKVTLPAAVIADKVRAEQEDGVLTVRFPLETKNTKPVSVKVT